MLTELRIRNFAVIEEAALSFGPGLNVLTGETAAGKTIIMTALGLLLGGRAAPDMVRAGAKEAVVEGVFELEGEAPPPEAAQWIGEENPRELLVQIYGQHEQQTLLLRENHQQILDQHAPLEAELARYRVAYDRAGEIRA